jgi:DNA-3-methyladenine glycosylase II
MPILHSAAVAHLGRACPEMKALIRRVGPCALQIETGRTPFQALVSAVAHQQLHGKAAQTILGRYRKLFGGRFPGPKALASVTDDQLRGAGFSRAKTAAIRDLAEKAISGVVPGAKAIARGLTPRGPRSRRLMKTVAPGGSVTTRSTAT